ncbi:MAG TPA: exodeoxyribonuclease III [Gammaproteobacteria bacterium]|nr:exodeoxyribonuclease III [Gammaproteobacteria bacterium]
MTIATWNVNSLRARLPHVLTWLQDVKPDVLAVQETKVVNEDFPLQAIQELGYHVISSGQKAYNGVAIISRLPMPTEHIITDIPQHDDPQRRVLAVTINNTLRILNIYVPNGESVGSEKYQYKLRWLQHLDMYLQTELKTYPNIVVLGDFNIAPHERDVHDPAAWQGKVLFSEPERQAFQALLKVGFQDCFRQHAPDEQVYTWWDYRVNAFKRNMGLRIDHILASQTLAAHCVSCRIDKLPRSWERPSDHTPVIAEFEYE